MDNTNSVWETYPALKAAAIKGVRLIVGRNVCPARGEKSRELLLFRDSLACSAGGESFNLGQFPPAVLEIGRIRCMG